MENLENYGVAELRSDEMIEVEGGLWPALIAFAMVKAWSAWNMSRAY